MLNKWARFKAVGVHGRVVLAMIEPSQYHPLLSPAMHWVKDIYTIRPLTHGISQRNMNVILNHGNKIPFFQSQKSQNWEPPTQERARNRREPCEIRLDRLPNGGEARDLRAWSSAGNTPQRLSKQCRYPLLQWVPAAWSTHHDTTLCSLPAVTWIDHISSSRLV